MEVFLPATAPPIVQVPQTAALFLQTGVQLQEARVLGRQVEADLQEAVAVEAVAADVTDNETCNLCLVIDFLTTKGEI